MGLDAQGQRVAMEALRKVSLQAGKVHMDVKFMVAEKVTDLVFSLTRMLRAGIRIALHEQDTGSSSSMELGILSVEDQGLPVYLCGGSLWIMAHSGQPWPAAHGDHGKVQMMSRDGRGSASDAADLMMVDDVVTKKEPPATVDDDQLPRDGEVKEEIPEPKPQNAQLADLVERARLRRRQKGASSSATSFSAMFAQYMKAGERLTDWPEDIDKSGYNILATARSLREEVTKVFPRADERMKRLLAVALQASQLRLQDYSMREHILLVWLIEGEVNIRSHGGSVFIYHEDGAFQEYRHAVTPEATLGRVKHALLLVEGMYRLISTTNMNRDSDSVLSVLKTLTDDHPDEQKLCEAARMAALKANPFATSKKASRRESELFEALEGDAVTDGSDPWTTRVANAILKVSQQLMEKLLNDRFFTYICEWCESPREQTAGVAYTNRSIKFHEVVRGDGTYVSPIGRCSSNALYVRIPHPLSDAVAQAAVDRLERYYATSFWSLQDVLECGQAAQALCKRGINVDRLFIGLSPGGVGQSLYSSHLAAVYGENHHLYDPNIWCNEEEMRKQIEGIAGAIIFTGQEAPDSSKPMKEDLFKRFITGEGITGRRPYGITTRMMRIVGWKRLEVNRLLTFAGVTEANFNSILRRALVFEVQARFVDPEVLRASQFYDHEEHGFFPSDPTLQDFVTSGPAIAAAIRIQHGFETQHNAEACRTLIEQYSARGGDEGLTEETMRKSCGLPALPTNDGGTGVTAAVLRQVAAETDSLTQPVAGSASAKSSDDLIVSQVIESIHFRVNTVMTPAMFKYVGFVGKHKSRDELFRRLVREGRLIELPARTKDQRDRYGPSLSPQRSIRDVANIFMDVDAQAAAAGVSYPETVNAHALCGLASNPIRTRNVETYKQAMEGVPPKSGSAYKKRMTPTKSDALETYAVSTPKMQHSYNALCMAEQNLKNVVQTLTKADEASPNKRRRTTKSPERSDRHVPQFAHLDVHYKYTIAGIRTRRQATGVASQKFSRSQAMEALAHTIDLDIVNCGFTILHQLVTKIEAPLFPDVDMQTLRQLAEERDRLCDEMRLTRAMGKYALVSVLNGRGVKTGEPGADVLRGVQRLGKALRWLSWELLPDLHRQLTMDASRSNPDVGIMFHMWSAVEDMLLDAWCEHVRAAYRPTHLSLHYDGIRVCLPGDVDVAEVCRTSERYIAEKLAFQVHIVQKKHYYVLDMLHNAAQGLEAVEFGERQQQMLGDGNCIPLSLCCLDPAHAVKCSALLDRPSPRSALAYRDVAKATDINLIVQYWAMEDEWCQLGPGSYLMHVEGRSGGHCVAIQVSLDKPGVLLFSAGAKCELSPEAMATAVLTGVDASKVVIFAVTKGSAGDRCNRDTLDGLVAGAGASSSHEPAVLPDDPVADDVEMDAMPADALIASLCEEVTHNISMVRKSKRRTTSCPLCPFREFDRTERVVAHLKTYHTRRHRWTPSGGKMLNVIMALWDNDQLVQRGKGGRYAERAAEHIRRTVDPTIVAAGENADARMQKLMGDRFDKQIRLVVDADGPRYVNKEVVEGPGRAPHRRIGNTYITKKFAADVFVEAVTVKSSIGGTRTRMEQQQSKAGSELVSLVPGGRLWWETLLEDIFYSPACDIQLDRIRQTWLDMREYESIGIDCTFRMLYSLKGQAPHTAPRIVQQAQALQPDEALHALLTVKGATGGVLWMEPLQHEGADYMRESLSKWSDAQLAQVRHIATDDPSRHLFLELQKMCPNLEFMSLDGMHLVFRYEQAWGRNSTASSLFLRKARAVAGNRTGGLNWVEGGWRGGVWVWWFRGWIQWFRKSHNVEGWIWLNDGATKVTMEPRHTTMQTIPCPPAVWM